jgi:uncharacterized membrane protein
MFESIGRSFALVKTSWGILMEDKKLLAFPVLSGVITLLVILSFVLPVVFIGTFLNTTGVQFYGILFLFYVVSYFVVIFFNTALISCVNARLQGKEMSVSEGLSNAAEHVTAILAWALISATIGLVLHLLEERSGLVGEIVLSIIGGVWSLVTFFVVPVLILEDKGVVDSVKESFALIRKTWGESIIGAGSIMIIFIAIGIVGFLGVIGASFIGGIAFALAIVLFLILLVVLGVVASAMQGIFMTALYTYAKTGMVPAAFHPDLIQNAFVPKQAGPGTI